jgi:hypothetical protein
MRHIKIWENFSNENPYPLSITVKPTQEYKNRLAEIKNSDGKPTFLAGQEFTLWNNNDRMDGDNWTFNIVKVATTPFEIGTTEFDGKKFTGKQDDHWLTYHPELKGIRIDTSRIFGTSNIFRGYEEITNQDARWARAGDYRREGLVWLPSFTYCKFDEGFEVGMVDSRGYFEIIDTKFE